MKLADYEGKIHLLTSEIERQNELISNKVSEWETQKEN